MNNPNPLLAQGTIPPKPKSTLYFKILMIVAVHVVLLGGLLIVGCNKDPKLSSAAKTDATAATDPMSPPKDDFGNPTTPASTPAVTSAALPPSMGNPTAGGIGASTPSLPVAAPTTSVTPISSTMTPASLPTPTPATAPAATGSGVYVIASGDLLSTIAKKNGVSLKALEEANPGVDPKKLQIGHKLQIPPSAGTAATASTGTGSTVPSTADSSTAPSTDASIYVVKSGDVLMRIARTHGTTVKAIETLNDMKTASIRAGQKLKVPVMKVASVDAAPASTPASSAPATTSGTTAPAVRVN